MMPEKLDSSELERYSRLLNLPDWSTEIQLRLKSSIVAVESRLIHSIRYLAATGVGTFVLVGAEQEIASREVQRLNPHTTISSIENINCPPDIFVYSEQCPMEVKACISNSTAQLEINLGQAALVLVSGAAESRVQISDTEELAIPSPAAMCAGAILAVNYLAFGINRA